MLKQLLDKANETLGGLIAQTHKDIENIKVANHAAVNESVVIKNRLIKEFETTKKDIDKELVALAKESGGSLSQSLDEDSKTSLANMRSKLEELHSINKEYARHVVSVKEFFDTMLKQMFTPNDDGGVYKARA
ncbi:flagellar export chaperone FlgN [Campylobacter sp. 19-13652]|uniref:flagellar export chaperone FlgN n=1 Tax=Campylobacter sp. 19-13652 TaxID=2840180 RepID=UPI001C77D618|nr:flagellar export chaperone FlgN [Campylobacter sp. 19-13652]BCX79751.1 flagellar protein FlgN [Campylobacter sp. 19-13652]